MKATTRAAPRMPDGTGSCRTIVRGGYRERVRAQRGEPGHGERTAPLIAELDQRGAQRVADDERQDKREVRAALCRQFGRDVTDREQETSGDSKC